MRHALILTMVLFFLIGSGVISSAEQTGVAGTVSSMDGQREPLDYVNVVVLGTTIGTFSQEGRFLITPVPPGTYQLQFSLIGYSNETRSVTVVDGTLTRVEVFLKESAIAVPEVIVEGRALDLPKTSGEVSRRHEGEVLKDLPYAEIEDAIANQAGVTKQGEEIHFRGGRGGEVVFKIDGVPIRDPLEGGTAAPAARGVEAVEATLGGITAEHGGALSGVVEYTTKEGGSEFGGEIFYMTDDYGQPDNTFTNLDRVYLGLGGPAPVSGVTYYLGAEASYSDGIFDWPREHGSRRILNFISVGDRHNNRVRLQGKLAYRPSPSDKFTVERMEERARFFPYHHAWSRVGYVQTIRDTAATGEVRVRYGRWSPVPVDQSYQYYNPANHTPTSTSNFSFSKVAWTRTLSGTGFFSLKASRSEFGFDQRVAGKEAWEYEGTRLSDFWLNQVDGTTEPFFVKAGDYPYLQTRRTIVYDARGDVTFKIAAHTVKTGLNVTYDDLKFRDVTNPFSTGLDGSIGIQTRYHAYAPKWAYFIQDRWEHEGMVLNIGCRYDGYSVGDQFALSEVRNPWSGQLSPRVGIAYPITDRSVFSFHYGRFYQAPNLEYVYAPSDVADGRVRGNPNLANETTSTYQAAIEHWFNDEVSAQVAVYYKDIFGLISTEDRFVASSVQVLPVWVNRDYASARGFEVTLNRKFADNFAANFAYTFGVATGTASDPNAAQATNFLYIPIAEQPLNWDARHGLEATLRVADQQNWHASLVWSYSSGFPYTPYGRQTRELPPEVVNSRRLPATSSVDVQLQKRQNIWGRPLKLYLEASNILDTRNIVNLAPVNFPAPPSGSTLDYLTYYSETGRAGGAYEGEDLDGDGAGDWVALNDPRVFEDPRTVRVGVSLDF